MMQYYQKNIVKTVHALRGILYNYFCYWYYFIFICFVESLLVSISYIFLVNTGLYDAQTILAGLSTALLSSWLVLWCCAMKPSMLPRNRAYFFKLLLQCLLGLFVQYSVGFACYLVIDAQLFLFLKVFFMMLTMPLVTRMLETKRSIGLLLIDSNLLKECVSINNIVLALITGSCIAMIDFALCFLFAYDALLFWFLLCCAYLCVSFVTSGIHILLYIKKEK